MTAEHAVQSHVCCPFLADALGALLADVARTLQTAVLVCCVLPAGGSESRNAETRNGKLERSIGYTTRCR